MNVDVDRPPVRRGRQADIGRSDEPGCDQRAPEIVHLRALERIATVEAGDRLDVAGRKWRTAADADPAKASDRSGLHREDQASGLGCVVDFDLLLAKFSERESLLAECDSEISPGLDHILRNDRIARLDREHPAQAFGFGAGGFEARKPHRREDVLAAWLHGEDNA